jgi:hypothetical protein
MNLNPFDLLNTGYSLTELSTAINILPNMYSRISQLGLFTDVPLHTNTAMLELKDNSLTIIPTKPWGTPGLGAGPTKRTIRSIVIPHTPWEDTVMALDVMGIRKFGTDNVLETINDKILEKLQQARDTFDMTDEYRKVQALKGIVLDADGASELFNSFTFFGLTPKTIDFELGTTSKSVTTTVRKLKRYLEDNLMGERMTSVRVFVGDKFFDKLINHPSIKEIWLNWSGAQARLGTDLRTGFEVEGVIFEEYRGMVPKPDGSGAIKFIEDADGIAVPMGTRNTFKRFLAPADYIETVNTLAQPYYAKQVRMLDDRGINLYAQSNTLPICCRPSLLVKVTTSN